MSEPDPDDRFRQAIQQQVSHHQQGKHATQTPSIALLGIVGWTISLTTLAGVFLGRWLDHQANSGTLWTLTFLGIGLGMGCLAAWRILIREVRE